MQRVVDWLAGAGVTVTGFTLTKAFGVSADGTVVVGTGTSASGPEAWIGRVGFISGLITLSDLNNSLASVGGLMNGGRYVTSLPFYGAHHRPLLSYHGLTSGRCVWASGDLADYGHQEDGEAGLAEVGGCYDLIPQRLRLGVGVGKSYLDQDLSFAGESDLDGEYIIAEVDYALEGLPLLASLTGMYGEWDADVTRGYLNAGVLDASFGDTDITAWAVRGRLDWVNAFQYSDIHFTPRVAYTVSRVDVDGYTESGGGFPVRFNSRELTSHEARYGIEGEVQVADATWVRGMVEGVHRFDDDEPVLSGQVLGLFSFALDGRGNQSNWARVGAEVEHHFTPDLQVSASVHGSTVGEDPVVSGGLSLKYAF
jgi:hypothetical protein